MEQVEDIRFYAPIQKIDEEKRMVYGYATTETQDSQNEVVDLQASFDAVDEWREYATIKEMHNPQTAAGIAPIIEKHAGVGVYIGAKIVDDQAWRKCIEKVYRGFSIGGKTLEKSKDKLGKMHITKYKLHEVSLVDKPANPDTLFVIAKRDFTGDADASKEADGGKAMPEEVPKVEVPAATPTTEAAVLPIEKAETTVSKPEVETLSVAKADYEKMTSRLEQLEKIASEKGKENEAKDVLLKMVEELTPIIRKGYEEVKPVEKTAEEKESEMKAALDKMSIGELSGYMFKNAPEKK